MSLPHVLLGLLSEEPRTGYDLARLLEEQLAPLWRAEISQIYPTLARLRRAGFVLLRVLGPRRGPPRNLYRITAAGRRELRRWVAEPIPPPRGRDEGLTRIAFSDALPLEERRSVLLRYEKTISEEICRLQSPPELAGFRADARRGAIERLEATRRWLRGLVSRGLGGPEPSTRGEPSAVGSGGSARRSRPPLRLLGHPPDSPASSKTPARIAKAPPSAGTKKK